MKSICIIVPVFNEEHNIAPLYQQLRTVMENIAQLKWCLLFIDDGSTDQTFTRICELARNDYRIQGISFSRHFGHQAALMAGIQAAQADWIVTMDGDLQHPPALIGKMISYLQQGYDVVHAVRTPFVQNRRKQLLSRWFYALYNYLSELPITYGAGDFRMFNDRVRAALLQFDERTLFIRGLLHWVGFKAIEIPYEAAPRASGKSKYSFIRKLHLAWDALTAFSLRPMRLFFGLVCFMGLLSIIYVCIALISHLLGKTMMDSNALWLGIIFIGGLQLLAIGLLGEYLGKVYKESQKRPLYLIRETVNR